MSPRHFTCPGALVRPGKEPCPHQSRQPRRGSVSGQRSHCQKQEVWVSPLLCGSCLTRVSLFCRRTHPNPTQMSSGRLLVPHAGGDAAELGGSPSSLRVPVLRPQLC